MVLPTLLLSAVLAFDSTSLVVDHERAFLVSGEFHYFRVPKNEWKRRLELFKAVGGNCIATYIPWIIHEPEEGKILFGDRPERDLQAFLELVKAEGLMAIVRPGPYQYSELVNAGLPRWLLKDYPEVMLKKPDGSLVNESAVDYASPTLLQKAKPYFKAVAEVIRPYLASNGGPIVLVQLDNELTGIHVWNGYQPSVGYYEQGARYLDDIRRLLLENGITGPYSHNAGTASMCASYQPMVEKLGTRDFILGYDHYYGLNQGFVESPTPYYFFDALFACDLLRGYGFPPVGFEIQCGTIGDIPPILKEDLLAAYMLNLAAGMKGINYYVFTGGPNFEDTGATGKIYDYQAPVSAEGEVRPTYEALREFGDFLKAHPELLTATRETSVRLGLEWRHAAHLAPFDEGFNRYGAFYSLMQSAYSPEYYLLKDAEIPLDGKPLFLAGVSSMSEAVQARVATFVEKGGKLLVAPDFPQTDLEGKPCTLLRDRVGGRARKLAKTWKTQHFAETEALVAELKALKARPILTSLNPNVFWTAHRLADGRLGVFLLNLRSGAQATTLVDAAGERILTCRLPAMSVQYKIFQK